jgi:pantoate--beta-alanine ligase
MLEEIDCHILFHPSYEQVYGTSEPREYDLGHLNDVMEGMFRPGHFQGVANVVMRFFEIVQPDIAFFGLKDYQQYMVIKRVTAQHMPQIQIMGVDTIRDEKGLALSSRNLRLSAEEYESAALVPELLKKVGKRLEKYTVQQTKTWFTNQVNKIPHLQLEYIELADANTLELVNDPAHHTQIRVFTAFTAGQVRLIDNMPLY